MKVVKSCRSRGWKSFSIGKIGVNVNGDLSEKEIAETAKVIERSGVKIIWVGEFEDFADPFEVAEIIAKNTSLKVGFGVVSPLRRGCNRIEENFAELRKKFGDRFILGLGAGSYTSASEAFQKLTECALNLVSKFRVVVGCSSPKITEFASLNTSGVLFNCAHPECIRWLSKYLRRKVFTAAYAPALITPSEFEEDLLIAASVVLTGGKTGEIVGIANAAKEVRSIDLKRLIDLRREGKSIFSSSDSEPILRYRELLIEKLTISGDIREIIKKIRELLKLCDHVVLADPFFRDPASLSLLEKVVVECEMF